MRTLLYFDGENLHWSLMHHHSRELDLGVVLHLAAVEGEVYEARLYADFSRFPREIATRARPGGRLCACAKPFEWPQRWQMEKYHGSTAHPGLSGADPNRPPRGCSGIGSR